MKRIVALLLLTIAVVFAANLVRGPKVSTVPIIGNYDPSLKPLPPPAVTDEPMLIYQVPDLRSTAGSPGKNIAFANDGQNVAVIYNRFSGDPDNMMQVFVAYSTDCGNNWIHYGPLSTFNARRTYPGLDAEKNWPDPADLKVHFAWHQAPYISGSYDSSPAYYAKEVMYPDGLITAAFRMPNSGTWDVWLPCIAVKDSFVIYIAPNNGTFLTTFDAYIWRSTDYGETWDDGRVFFPGPLEWMSTPHFRFGSDGYMFFLWNRAEESNPANYWPYYCESSNYGETWTQPQLIWQGNPPYPNMSNVKGWWYEYDCEVVNDTPVAAVHLSSGDLDFGELLVYRPTSGSPGNWQFTGTKLVYGDSTSPLNISRYAQVAKDDRGDIFIGYQANFITPTDTALDCGMFVRPYNRDVWLDWELITYGRYAAATDQQQLELAHNAPIVGTSPNDSAVVGFIWTNAQDYPTTGNLYYEDTMIPIIWIDTAHPYIAESELPNLNKLEITVTPNPAINTFAVKYLLPKAGPVSLKIYDVTGTLVKSYNNSSVSKNGLVQINTKTLSSGVYILRFSSGETNITRKVVVEK